jgi:ubiquitin-protein ligase
LSHSVYPTGEVCISILHPPVEDPLNPQEKLSEKWNPILTMEAVLISVTSMLVDPNLESPANVDAAKLMKENRKEYDRKLRYLARKSIGDV